MMSALSIDKELIPACSFSDQRNNLSTDQQKINDKKLYRAMLLGNGYHNKVKISFATTEGKRQVETTVWAYTESYVILKGGVFIPVESVIDVNLD